MRKILVVLFIFSFALAFGQGLPHLIFGSAENSDGSPIPDGCGAFIAFAYPSGADTLTQDSENCSFDGSDWAVQIGDLGLEEGDSVVIILYNTCIGETAMVLVEIAPGPAQDAGLVTLVAGAFEVVTVVYPNGGESFEYDDPINIQWFASEAIIDVDIFFSSNGGGSWTPVTSGYPADAGNYPWFAPHIESALCLIKIEKAGDPAVADISDGFFEIVPSPMIDILAPIAGSDYIIGENIEISWEGRAIAGADLYFSSDGGLGWELIQAGLSATGTYNFAAPDVESDLCMVRAWASDDHGIVDYAGVFTIGPPPDVIPPDAIDDLSADTIGFDRVFLSWTITGDDGNVGLAAESDLRYYNAPITGANWGLCTPIDGEPAPAAPGIEQGMWVEGLLSGETYYFAMKVADEVPNWSALSNVVEVIIPEAPDTIPPEAFELIADVLSCTGAEISWLAPGDDGDVGTADRYDFRMAEFELNEGNFDDGGILAAPAPQIAGTEQVILLDVLEQNTHYWIAAYAFDEEDNQSPFTVIDFTTPICEDTIPPGRINMLSCADYSPLGVRLFWFAPGDDEYTGTAASYEVRCSTEPFDTDTWMDADSYFVEMLPGESGSEEYLWVVGLESATDYYFAVFAFDEVNNRSPMSVLAHCITMGIENPVADIYIDEDAPDTFVADLEDVFLPSSGLIYWAEAGEGVEVYYGDIDSSEVWLHLLPDFYGNTYIYLCARHSGYAICDTVGVHIAHYNDPPYFTNETPDSLAIPGIPYEFEFTAEDPDGDSLWFFIVDGLDDMELLSDGSFSWMPPWYLGEGLYEITVAVTDGYDTVNYIFSVYVLKVTNPLFAPRNLVAFSGFIGCIPLLWDIPEAIEMGYPVVLSGYEIYRSTVSDSGFVSIGNSDLNTYNDVTPACGTAFYYTVRAVYDIPDAQSSQSNVASGICNSSASRIYSAWTTLPPSIDGFINEALWSMGAVTSDEAGNLFAFVNTADKLYGYVKFQDELEDGFEYSFWFDDDNDAWWDGLPSDEGRIFFRYNEEIVSYFQPVADIGGSATRGTIVSMPAASAVWGDVADGVVLEFSIPLADVSHLGIYPGDSTGIMLHGADSTATFLRWTDTSVELAPETYGRLVLGSPGGVPNVCVYPNSIDVTLAQGDWTSFEILVQNLGDAAGYFEILAMPEWVDASPTSGYILPLQIEGITLIITAAMEPGDYVGTMLIYTTDPVVSEREVEIVLHVIEGDPESYLVISVPSATYTDPGEEIEIPVTIGDIYDNEITRIRFTLNTDDDIVEPLGADGGAILPGEWSITVTSIGEEHITVELSGAEPLPVSGEIARISYAVNANVQPGFACEANLSDPIVNSGNPIPILNNGLIIIGDEILSFWSAMIILKDTTGARLDSASFGIHPLASNDYDRVIDKLDPPMFPGSGNIYFVADDSYKLTRDLRHLGDRILIFPLVSDTEGSIEWDPNRVWKGCFIGDTLDMKGIDYVDVSVGDTVYIYYHYESPWVIEVELIQGWNLVSLPFADDSIALSEVFPDVVGGQMFYFDQDYGTYNISSGFRSGQAYWAFNMLTDTYTASGYPLFQFDFSLQPGWFMLGSLVHSVYWIEQPSQPEDALIRTFCLGYDAEAHLYYNSNIIKPGKGYWIYVLEDCTFKMSAIYVNP